MKKTFIFKAISLMLLVIVLSGCGQNQATTETAPAAPKTEITARGQGATIVISPSVDKRVKGVITLTLTEVSTDAQIVSFAMELGNSGEPVVLGQADGNSDWSIIVDTTLYENGLYTIGGVTFASVSGGTPVGMARTQIFIDN